MAKAPIEHPSYKAMSEAWGIVDSLCGGTAAMRAAGTEYLPQEPRESNAAYRVRLNRSFLFPGVKETIKMLSAKPFEQDVVLESTSEDIKDMVRNIDLMGRDLTNFSKDVLTDSLKYGLSHILVDYPQRDEGAPTDLATQKAQGIRPYFVHVKAKNLISWETQEINGRTQLLSITMKESSWENKDGSQVAVQTYRKYTTDTVTVFVEKSKNRVEVLEEYSHSFGAVPLVTVYSNRTGFMMAQPPLLDMAYTNLAHWQSASDQRNILRIARVPFLVASGFSDEAQVDADGNYGESEIDMVRDISPQSLFASTNENADIKWVEHSGAGIGAGEKDLDTLKEEMLSQGAQFLIPKKSNMTATEYAGNQNSTQSDLQAVVASLESGLVAAFDMAEEWLEIEAETDVNVFRDFNRNLNMGSDIDLLYKSREKGFITQETYLTELKRRDVLSDAVDVEEEIESLELDENQMADVVAQFS